MKNHTRYILVWLMLPWLFFAKAGSLALAIFYAGLLGVPNHHIPDYWRFTVFLAPIMASKSSFHYVLQVVP
jgi:hypothetical protein